MALNKSNRIILLAGAGVAVVAAVGAASLFGSGRPAPTEAPPASQGGLTVELTDAPSLAPGRELRCFVDGQFVGLATLVDCAQRNGVATSALDVGLDASGSLTAAPTAAFAPPPDIPMETPSEAASADAQSSALDARARGSVVTPVAGPNTCMRYAGSEWRLVGDMGLNACVQALYSGVCLSPGEAQYGRWGDTSLRLVPRRVEQSRDNVRFQTLARQDRACQFAELG